MAVWGMKWYIVGTLVVISIGQWSLLLHGILITAVWVPDQGCAVTSTKNTILCASFIYGMAFDLIVLLLTAFKLGRPSRPSMPKSRLVHLMFTDGLYYFFIAYVHEASRSQRIVDIVSPYSFFANLIATVCNFNSTRLAKSDRAPCIDFYGY